MISRARAAILGAAVLLAGAAVYAAAGMMTGTAPSPHVSCGVSTVNETQEVWLRAVNDSASPWMITAAEVRTYDGSGSELTDRRLAVGELLPPWGTWSGWENFGFSGAAAPTRSCAVGTVSDAPG